jgi:flagellar hook-associated protein 1
VYDVGSLTAAANAQAAATTASLQQLADQQSSVSGVSIDEESTNLIRFQQSYEAAAKVVNTVNTLFGVTINMISS